MTIGDLLKSLGGVPAGAGVTFIAKDGYEMTMSADQVNSGKFVTYDVSTGDEVTIQDPLQLALAYEVDGKPLDPETDGTFRVAILSAKSNQVTDGHWWVKWVTKVEVKPVVVGWSLALTGAIQDTVDLGSFDSCSAPNCHGVTWKDTNGVTWSGVPLYQPGGPGRRSAETRQRSVRQRARSPRLSGRAVWSRRQDDHSRLFEDRAEQGIHPRQQGERQRA